jgi:hypothetical protein
MLLHFGDVYVVVFWLSFESWYSANCILPIFSNSFFNIENVEDKSNAPTGTSGVNVTNTRLNTLEMSGDLIPKMSWQFSAGWKVRSEKGK